MELFEIYRVALKEWSESALAMREDLTDPQLVDIDVNGYRSTPVRVMVVGQQPDEWLLQKEDAQDSIDSRIQSLLTKYANDFPGRGTRRSKPFWYEARKLYQSLNPDGPTTGFVWSNVIKIAQRGSKGKYQKPDEQVMGVVRKVLTLLPGEMRIAAPHVIVFFTGPKYDDEIRRICPGVCFELLPGEPKIARLAHEALPRCTYRTYHPRSLWHSKRRDVITTLIQTIKEEMKVW